MGTRLGEVIKGIRTSGCHTYKINFGKTIDLLKKQYGEEKINEALSSGVNNRIKLIGKGQTFYMTSGSAGDASGSYLAAELPPDSPKLRQQTYQLPPYNDAVRVNKVVSNKAQIGIQGDVASQKEWAEEAGYAAGVGGKQVYTPSKTGRPIDENLYKKLEEVHYDKSETTAAEEIVIVEEKEETEEVKVEAEADDEEILLQNEKEALEEEEKEAENELDAAQKQMDEERAILQKNAEEEAAKAEKDKAFELDKAAEEENKVNKDQGMEE